MEDKIHLNDNCTNVSNFNEINEENIHKIQVTCLILINSYYDFLTECHKDSNSRRFTKQIQKQSPDNPIFFLLNLKYSTNDHVCKGQNNPIPATDIYSFFEYSF